MNLGELSGEHSSLTRSSLIVQDHSLSSGLLDGIWDGMKEPVRLVKQAIGAQPLNTDNGAEQSTAYNTGKVIGTALPFVGALCLFGLKGRATAALTANSERTTLGATEALAADPSLASSATQGERAIASAPSLDNLEQRYKALDNIRKEVGAVGENPADALANALRKSRVVMVGEYHVQDSIHRELGAELMPELKKAGMTHLAIEHSSDFTGKIFDAAGKLDTESLPELLRHREFFKLLEAAQREGIEVVPVDGSYNASRDLFYRNMQMDKNIATILENPKNKVLFWVGNKHLQMTDATGAGAQVAQLLRERNIPVTTFYGQHDNFWREEPLRNLFTPNRPLAVPTASAPTLRSLNWLHPDEAGYAVHRFSEFDYVLMHPKQIPAHWD